MMTESIFCFIFVLFKLFVRIVELSTSNVLYFRTLKVWVFWEGHKIWKNLRHTIDKSVVFCARQIFQQIDSYGGVY